MTEIRDRLQAAATPASQARRVEHRDPRHFRRGTAVARSLTMRNLLVSLAFLGLGLGVGACTRSNGLYIGGGDGAASSDLALVDLAGADLRGRGDGGGPPVDLSQPPGSDLGQPVCVSTCNRCTVGACCPGGKNGCCAPGEYCDSNGQCRCGQNSACSLGLICATGGPVMGGGQCGSICCGDPQHPCPL